MAHELTRINTNRKKGWLRSSRGVGKYFPGGKNVIFLTALIYGDDKISKVDGASGGQKPFREKVSGLPKAFDKCNKNP